MFLEFRQRIKLSWLLSKRNFLFVDDPTSLRLVAACCFERQPRKRSRLEDDLPPRMPLLELPERCADVGEREGRGDRHVKLAFGDQSGELRQDPGVPRLLAALSLDAVLLRGGEIDDRVDAVLGHAQFDRQVHVAAAMAVDERVETELAQPVGQALAVGHSLDALLREPSVIGGARDADHLRAGPPGELDRDRADAARRGRHRNRVAGFERYGMHRGIGRAARDRERSRDLPGDPAGFGVRFRASATTYSAWLARLSVKPITSSPTFTLPTPGPRRGHIAVLRLP